MAESDRARNLGSQISATVLTVSAQLFGIAHWLLNVGSIVLLHSAERVIQHESSRSDDAMGQVVHPQGTV